MHHIHGTRRSTSTRHRLSWTTSAASPLGEVQPLLQGHLILETCFSFCIPSVRAKIIAFQFFLLPANPMVPAISRLRLSNSIVIGRDPNLGPADPPNKPLADLSSSNVFIFRWLKSGLRGARELMTTATLASIWNQKLLPACFWVRVVLVCHSFKVSR